MSRSAGRAAKAANWACAVSTSAAYLSRRLGWVRFCTWSCWLASSLSYDLRGSTWEESRR